MLRTHIKRIRVVGIKLNRKVPLEAVFQIFNAMAHWIVRPNSNVAPLFGNMVIACQKSAVTPGINNVWVFRMGCHVGAFTTPNCIPIIFCYTAPRCAGWNGYSTVILLPGIDAIGELIVYIHTVELGCGLVMIGTPSFTGVKGNLSATIVSNNEMFRILGVNPKVMVIPVGGTNSIECFTTIFGAPE